MGQLLDRREHSQSELGWLTQQTGACWLSKLFIIFCLVLHTDTFSS